METVKIEAEIVHYGFGYELTEDGKVRMRVSANRVKEGDVVVSPHCEFGKITSMIVIREITNCEFKAIRILP